MARKKRPFFKNEETFIRYCFNRTQIDTTYNVLLSDFRCDCVNCSDRERDTIKYFQIFLVANNHNFDQPIINTCELKQIFPDRLIEHKHVLDVFLKVCEINNWKVEEVVTRGTVGHSISAGLDIEIAKNYLIKILKALYEYGIDENFSNINDAVIFFD